MKPNPITTTEKPANLPQPEQETQKPGSYEVNLSAQFEDLEETTETKKSQKDSNTQSQEEPDIKHYIIPGTMFEGQYDYVTKQKKQQDVEQQLSELQNQKRQLEISTQHYINPTTVVESQVQKGGKLLKKQPLQKQLNQIVKEHQQNDQVQTQTLKPKLLHRVNLHEFNSTQVPELHQQDIPVNLQPVEVNQNLNQGIGDTRIMSIKPLEPVKLDAKKIEKSNVPNLSPASLDKPLESLSKSNQQDQKKSKTKEQQKHYIIPGTCFEGQFQYVTKEKKEDDVAQQLRQLDHQKRQLEIGTQHYVVPTNVVKGKVPNAQKVNKPQFPQHLLKQTQNKPKQPQKKEIPQNKYQKGDNKQNEPKNPKTHKYFQQNRSSFMNTQLPQADTEGLKLTNQRSKDRNFIKMQIQSQKPGKLPYKIDQYTCMTVMSSDQQERPTLNFPFSEEPNDDVEIIVMETSLNKEATSPKDLVNQRTKDVLGNQQMQSVIEGMRNRDGSPMKVVIGTKQFANYPGQSAPSPPIIDETTLSDFRKKNNSQYLQKDHQSNQGAFYIESINDNQRNPEEIEISRISLKEKTSQITHGKDKVQVEHLHVTVDVDKVKKVDDQNEKKPKSILPKIIKSAMFSSLIGGLAWLSLEDKKIAAISAATGFVVAFIIQK